MGLKLSAESTEANGASVGAIYTVGIEAATAAAADEEPGGADPLKEDLAPSSLAA